MKIWKENRRVDTVEKHGLTGDDIDFLKDLQKEMNEQDHFGNRDPVYWIIQGTERVFGLEDGYSCLVSADYGDGFWGDMEAVAGLINDKLKEAYTGKDDECFAKLENGDYIEIFIDGENTDTIFDMDEAAAWLSAYGMEVRATTYEDRRKNYDRTAFLTYRDACEHLRANYYHYSEDAHPYAMTAWRNPTISRLYKILQETDWDSIRG